ncbi:unnamed protein product, partial [Ectocarpus sp. 8 AP-2014]
LSAAQHRRSPEATVAAASVAVPSAVDSAGAVSGPGAVSRDDGGAVAGTGVVSSPAVIEVDEYGDDFDFLTDADLQALEDQAAKTSSAVASSQLAAAAPAASQQTQNQRDVGDQHRGNSSSANGRQTPPPGSANQITGLAGSQAGRNGFDSSDRGANSGGSAVACRGGGSGREGSRAKPKQQQVTGSKRAFNGSAGRPPLSAIGPNPERGD